MSNDRSIRKAYLETVVERSNTIIYLKDNDGRFLFVNEQFQLLFGIKKEALIGKKPSELFGEVTAAAFDKGEKEVLEMRSALTIRELFPLPDGTVRSFITVKTPIYDEVGLLNSIVVVSTDITSLVYYDVIENVQESLARDLIKIVSPITMAVQLLEKHLTDEKDKRILASITKAAQEGAELISQLRRSSG